MVVMVPADSCGDCGKHSSGFVHQEKDGTWTTKCWELKKKVKFDTIDPDCPYREKDAE